MLQTRLACAICFKKLAWLCLQGCLDSSCAYISGMLKWRGVEWKLGSSDQLSQVGLSASVCLYSRQLHCVRGSVMDAYGRARLQRHMLYCAACLIGQWIWHKFTHLCTHLCAHVKWKKVSCYSFIITGASQGVHVRVCATVNTHVHVSCSYVYVNSCSYCGRWVYLWGTDALLDMQWYLTIPSQHTPVRYHSRSSWATKVESQSYVPHVQCEVTSACKEAEGSQCYWCRSSVCAET